MRSMASDDENCPQDDLVRVGGVTAVVALKFQGEDLKFRRLETY